MGSDDDIAGASPNAIVKNDDRRLFNNSDRIDRTLDTVLVDGIKIDGVNVHRKQLQREQQHNTHD